MEKIKKTMRIFELINEIERLIENTIITLTGDESEPIEIRGVKILENLDKKNHSLVESDRDFDEKMENSHTCLRFGLSHRFEITYLKKF